MLAHCSVLHECRRWHWWWGKVKGTPNTGLETLRISAIKGWSSILAAHERHLGSFKTLSAAQAVKLSSVRMGPTGSLQVILIICLDWEPLIWITSQQASCFGASLGGTRAVI